MSTHMSTHSSNMVGCKSTVAPLLFAMAGCAAAAACARSGPESCGRSPGSMRTRVLGKKRLLGPMWTRGLGPMWTRGLGPMWTRVDGNGCWVEWQVALGRFGSGWAWLYFSHTDKNLQITSTANQVKTPMSAALAKISLVASLDYFPEREKKYVLQYLFSFCASRLAQRIRSNKRSVWSC